MNNNPRTGAIAGLLLVLVVLTFAGTANAAPIVKYVGGGSGDEAQCERTVLLSGSCYYCPDYANREECAAHPDDWAHCYQMVDGICLTNHNPIPPF
jgi:hypothetical protein